MSEYTPEDFANARFAEHPDGRLAMRDLDLDYHPWSVSGPHAHVARSDDGLAAAGWRPVHEDTPLTLDTLREAAPLALEDLREENDRLERILRAPLSLKDLRVAWESAIVATAVHVGDTLIQRDHLGESFSVFKAERDYPRPPLDIRVLHRAPEPWHALADVMRQWDATLETGHSADSMARWFYERGVRVTGGDDDE